MFFLFFVTLISSSPTSTIKNYLEKKKYAEAHHLANEAIKSKGDLNADIILFLYRGSANVHLKKFNQGITDLSTFLGKTDHKSGNQKDIIQAYYLRSTAHLRLGNLDEAKTDAEKSKDDSLMKEISKAHFLYMSAIAKDTTPRYVLEKYSALVKICTHSAIFMREAARFALKTGNTTSFDTFSKRCLSLSPKDEVVLDLKGRYHFSKSENVEAQKHLNFCIKVCPNSTECKRTQKDINDYQANEQKAQSYSSQKQYQQAKKHIEICLPIVKKYAPDGSQLSNRFKKIYVEILLAVDDKETALENLDDLIQSYPDNNDYLLQRGKILIDFSDYTGALKDFQIVKKRTNENSNDYREAVRLTTKASKLQEEEKNENYYDVLGIRRGASIDEVNKAYRKLVIKWHPDRYSKTLQKKAAEKKMMNINRAYEVLSDKNKKKSYSNNNSNSNSNNDYDDFDDFDFNFNFNFNRNKNQQQHFDHEKVKDFFGNVDGFFNKMNDFKEDIKEKVTGKKSEEKGTNKFNFKEKANRFMDFAEEILNNM